MDIFTKTCSAKSANMEMYLYIYVCTYVYIYICTYIYNLATHLNLELTHHNCVGFTEGPNRYHRWLDYILILGVMKVHSTPMLYWWRRCVCGCVCTFLFVWNWFCRASYAIINVAIVFMKTITSHYPYYYQHCQRYFATQSFANHMDVGQNGRPRGPQMLV